MSLQITAEQQEKVDYISALQTKYTEHLDNMARVLETGINTMDEILEGTNTSHLDKVERGYENMSHFTAHLERERRALLTIDFLKDEEEDEEEEDALVDRRGRSSGGSDSSPSQTTGGGATSAAAPPPSLAKQLSRPPTHAPPAHQGPAPMSPQPRLEAPDVAAGLLLRAPSPKHPAGAGNHPSPATPLGTPHALAPPTGTSAQAPPDVDPEDGPRHVFSFSWLNQK
ncbi:hypothetical protein CRUP_011140 [Coryphaenoides rupestris]|nr:hypothetical protein CRUP_011140 [Coryphaenoides rupestris]